MSTVAVVTIVLVIVLGVPFTLWWWKIADRWASDEHKRFKAPRQDSRGGRRAESEPSSKPARSIPDTARSGANPFARGARSAPPNSVERIVIEGFESKERAEGDPSHENKR